MSLAYDNRPIGVFDSGLGGLTVVRALKKALPNESFFYLGDTARVPYGDKSEETIIRFGCENSHFLIQKGVKLVVVACNTVSAVAMETLHQKFPNTPILGVLESGVNACLRANGASVTILGTKATARSDAYRRAIHAKNSAMSVNTLATPLFVPLIEEGLQDSPVGDEVVKYYLHDVIENPTQMLLLGCTHYPLIADTLRKYFPTQIMLDSAQSCAEFVIEYLHKNHLDCSKVQRAELRFYLSDVSTEFLTQAQRFLGEKVSFIERVKLETLNV